MPSHSHSDATRPAAGQCFALGARTGQNALRLWVSTRDLIAAAHDDLHTSDAVIGDPDAPDSGIGFRCQQATEKLLKAVLARRGVHFEKTHNLGYLFGLVARTVVPLWHGS